jgi:hypothetical protein
MLIGAVVSALFAGDADAAYTNVISFSSSLSGSSYDSYPDPLTLPLHLDGSIALNQFNTAWGTLNSVTVDLSSAFRYGTIFENTSLKNGSVVSIQGDQRLMIGSLLDTGSVQYSLIRKTAAYDGLVDFTGASGFTVTDSRGVTTVRRTYTGIDMAPYIGTGSLLLDVFSAANIFSGFSGGNGILNTDQSFITSATVTYDATPLATPIPAAFVLFGSGLIGVAGMRKQV